ncbi:hypothetical protein [Nocardioides dongkuii]|uniref:hypothetical protein n=1 Tax=Nocardioides dongkuii TaxID=2760089 RepID=UPI0015F7B134|nr:hypothetical protein [Nocardioides dongkuii]
MSAQIIDAGDVAYVRRDLESGGLAEAVLTCRTPTPLPDARTAIGGLGMLSPPLQARAALWIRNQERFEEELPQTVYQAIVLDGPAAIGSNVFDLMLLQVPRVAGRLTEAQAIQLFKTLWPFASALHDPYDPGAKKPVTASALVRLVAQRPEVETELVALAKSLSGYQRSEAVDLLARGVRARGQAAPAAFIQVATTMPMTPAELARFAQVAETAQRISPSGVAIKSDLDIRQWRLAVSKLLELLLAIVPAPALIAALLILNPPSPKWLGNIAVVQIPVDAAVAIVALIATVNVFTVQLSTQRLPGTVARAASQPRILLGAYIAAGALLMSILFTPASPPALWVPMQSAAALLSIGWLAVALGRIFGKTDTAEACRTFVDQNIARWARTGRRFGKSQARAVQLQRSVESLPFIKFSGAEMLGHDVVLIKSEGRGVTLPNRRTLRKALTAEQFATGGYLQIVHSFGLVVGAGETVAVVRPPAGASVPVALQRQISDMLRPRSAKALEDVSTQTVNLVSLALNTVGSGESRIGESVAEQASRIIRAHMAGVQSSRRKTHERLASVDGSRSESERQVYPVDPMLRDAVRVLVDGARGLRSGDARAAEVVLDACLAASGPADHVPVMVASALTDLDHGSLAPEFMASCLRSAGIRSIQLRQRDVFDMIVRQIAALANDADHEVQAIRSLAALGSACARLEPTLFGVAWRWVEAWASKSTNSTEITRVVMQMGAASLESGVFAAALECGEYINDSGHLAELSRLADLDHVFAEASAAALWSVYLGLVPTDSLERFRDLAHSLQDV